MRCRLWVRSCTWTWLVTIPSRWEGTSWVLMLVSCVWINNNNYSARWWPYHRDSCWSTTPTTTSTSSKMSVIMNPHEYKVNNEFHSIGPGGMDPNCFECRWSTTEMTYGATPSLWIPIKRGSLASPSGAPRTDPSSSTLIVNFVSSIRSCTSYSRNAVFLNDPWRLMTSRMSTNRYARSPTS